VSGIPFPQMGVFFVSREPVRNPEPLRVFAELRASLDRLLPGSKVPGTLSVAAQNRFAIAACPQGLGAAPESSIAEVYEYDPVRYQALVIGLVEPPADTPVHWIARRVNPEERVIAVVASPPALAEELSVHSFPRGYLGDPNTLLAIGRLLKGKSVAAIDRVGLVICGADGLEVARELAGALRRPE
jgi:DNA-binding transcriptional LysR family regulator